MVGKFVKQVLTWWGHAINETQGSRAGKVTLWLMREGARRHLPRGPRPWRARLRDHKAA